VLFSTVGLVSITGLSPDKTQVTLTSLGRKPDVVHWAIRETTWCSTSVPTAVTAGKEGLTTSKNSIQKHELLLQNYQQLPNKLLFYNTKFLTCWICIPHLIYTFIGYFITYTFLVIMLIMLYYALLFFSVIRI